MSALAKFLPSSCLHVCILLPDRTIISGPADFTSVLIDSVAHNRVCLSAQHHLFAYFLWASCSLVNILCLQIQEAGGARSL